MYVRTRHTMAKKKQVYVKASIPIAIREATWVTYNGQAFVAKCHVEWCKNVTTPFSYDVGHNVPESKGGSMDIENLRPICHKCNMSMGNRYTIDEFSALSKDAKDTTVNDVPIKKGFFTRLFSCS